MSLRYEQQASLWHTRELLRDLCDTRYRLCIKLLRERARHCLRHFPVLDETGKPIFSGDPFPAPSLSPTIASWPRDSGDERNNQQHITKKGREC